MFILPIMVNTCELELLSRAFRVQERTNFTKMDRMCVLHGWKMSTSELFSVNGVSTCWFFSCSYTVCMSECRVNIRLPEDYIHTNNITRGFEQTRANFLLMVKWTLSVSKARSMLRTYDLVIVEKPKLAQRKPDICLYLECVCKQWVYLYSMVISISLKFVGWLAFAPLPVNKIELCGVE